MPYSKMVELSERIRATDDPEEKIALMRELRVILDQESEKLKALRTVSQNGHK